MSEQQFEVTTRKLGLAAYMKMKGAELLEQGRKGYRFRTSKPLQEWSVEYANSCCAKHDAELISLRNMRKA